LLAQFHWPFRSFLSGKAGLEILSVWHIMFSVSKGIGSLQRHILKMFDGVSFKQWRPRGAERTTADILSEMRSLGVLPKDGNQKIQTFAVRRACRSLANRKQLKWRVVNDRVNKGRQTIAWKL
jgi:hypothetical protein